MGDSGKVMLLPRGEYYSATPYEELDCVYYQGRSYVCKQASTGHAPTDTTYWQPMTPDASAEIQALTNYVTDTGVKNLLPLTLENIKALNTTGTWTNNVYSQNGATIEVVLDSNNSVTGLKANGTPSADVTFIVGEPKKGDILTGCPSGGGWSNYVVFQNGGAVDMGSGASGVLANVRVNVYLVAGTAFDNLMFYPMVRDASITDPTYQPYAKTNVELTQDVASLIITGTATKSGITASANTVTDVNVTDIDIPAGYALKGAIGITIGSGGATVSLVNFFYASANAISVRLINAGAEKSGISVIVNWLAVKV